MSKAAERLAAQLEEAERRIAELEEENEFLRDTLPWTEHSELESDDSGLPVPRLELVWEEGSFPRGYNFRCIYRLVYRHFLGHIVLVPLSETLRGGAYPPDHYDLIETPFRDSVHARSDAEQLGIPAFVRFGNKSRPLNMTHGEPA